MIKRIPKKTIAKNEERQNYPLPQLMRDLWSHLSPYKGELAFATTMRLIGDIAQLWPWYAVSKGITSLTAWHTGDPTLPIFLWFASWAAAVLLRQITVFFAKTNGFMVGERAALDVRTRSMERLLALDIAWHEKENAGNKMQRITSAADGVYRYVRAWIGNIIEIIVSLIGILVIIATVDSFISLSALGFLCIYTPLAMHFRRGSSSAARAVNAEMEKVSGAMFESLNNVRTAKVLSMAPALLRIIGDYTKGTVKKIRVRLNSFQFANLCLSLLSIVFKLCALLYIVNGVMHGRYETGFILLFHGYFNRLTDAATELSDVSQDLEVARHAIGRLAEMNRTPVIDPGTKSYPKNWKIISLKNVSYSYAGQQVLRNISFNIRRGERVGLVGLSGAGKSTLFKLLLKELEDYQGDIVVDGLPLREIRKRDWYRHAAVVLQETEVFNFPLRQNVTIAAENGGRDRARLKRALDIAHVTDFLSKLPKGVETVIGEKGVKLSGGERQRVGIARAVFKRPDVLFLDEATSHLDLESEERIRDSLHVFFRDVTAVVIAHRLTTIKEMDRIFVLENGRLIEQGTFAELYNAHGRFHDLWEMQKLG